VLLAFAHEMQGNWYPWGAAVHGNTPADYIAAYRHVHDRFAKAGVKNVQWVWTPTADPEQAFPSLDKFYPGDNYTDWLGVDVYNDAAAQFHHSWRPLSQLLAPAYQRLAGLHQTKPMILVEWASVEKGGDKGAWIRDAGRSLPTQFPRVRAAVWFSSDSDDLRIDSSARAAAGARSAFQAGPFCARLREIPAT
jgi:beta-mannanase